MEQRVEIGSAVVGKMLLSALPVLQACEFLDAELHFLRFRVFQPVYGSQQSIIDDC